MYFVFYFCSLQIVKLVIKKSTNYSTFQPRYNLISFLLSVDIIQQQYHPFSFRNMHNPSLKSTLQKRNEFIVLSTLLLGKEPIQIAKVRQIKHESAKYNKVGKDKFANRIDQITQELNFLKVDGREISSIMNNDIKYKKHRIALPHKFQIQEAPLYSDLLKERKRFSQVPQDISTPYTKSYPNIFAENDFTINEDKIEQTENLNILLPEISSNKDIYSYNHSSLKKSNQKYIQKSIDKTAPNRSIHTKRRDTIDPKYSQQQPTKNKMDIKKNHNYLQYKEFLFTINLTNQIIIPPEQEAIYKACICKGNNGLLVKSILKNRPWWSFKNVNQIDNCNLVWTEWKRNKSINLLGNNDAKTCKNEYKQFTLNIKSTNKEIKQKSQKKFNNFSKIIGKNTHIYSRYDDSILNQNYLTFNSKLGNKSFEQNSEKGVKDLQLSVFPKNVEKKIVNHIPGCLFLHSKKLLFLSMSKYYEKLQKNVFDVIPLTFLITKGVSDPQFARFTQYFEENASKNKKEKTNSNIWICKPGQNSNRGNGIQVMSTLSEIRSLLGTKCGNGRTLIIQKYMENPFLYNKRKFDIRCYILITCVNGIVKGYWYQQGYVRTTSKQYTLKNLDNKLIHLTNDAIQKKGEQYGKFENFNKVSFAELEKYIENNTQAKFNTVYDKIKGIATDLIISVARKINPHHKQFTFQIFGLDFMLDDKLNVYLIQANSNPCLQVDGNVLGRVIPPMVQNAIKVAIDPIFPPPNSQGRNRFTPGSTFQTNKMFLVYDSQYDFPKEEISDELVEAAQKECQQFEGQIDQQ